MTDFYEDMNASPWKGIISEVGLGLEFSASFLRIPGASGTILGVDCDYAGLSLPAGERAVSLEQARYTADANLLQACHVCDHKQEPDENAFGLAITGAHYQDRDSHGWIYLATKKWNAYMHFSISASSSREWVGKVVNERVKWFLNSCLLSTSSWREHIEEIGDSLETHKIDVLYAPGVSDVERMLLLRPENPLVYCRGQFHRVVDYLRVYDSIFPGTFNPPTKAHLSKVSLFEITQNHCTKGSLAIGDLLDRMNMLSMSGKAVLVTQAPRFVDKYGLVTSLGMKEVTFQVGTDAWNALIAGHQYPNMKWLGEQMPHAKFIVRQRDDVRPEENAVSNNLDWDYVKDIGSKYVSYSSTEVRCSDDPDMHDFLTEEVAAYIRTRGLYLEE